MKHILIIASNGSSLINFRLNLIKDLLVKGYKVSVASPTTNFPKNLQKILQNLNIKIYNFSLSGTGLNILKDFLSCIQIYKIINDSKLRYNYFLHNKTSNIYRINFDVF